MKDITLRQLEYLVAVADEGSIAKGAAQCHVSPVAVGQALNELERTLGSVLVRRQRSKGITLTHIGEEVVDHARLMLRSMDKLPLLIDSVSQRMKPVLRIGSFPTLAGWAIPPIIAELSLKYPEVTVELFESNYELLHEKLRDGSLDIVVGLQNHVKPGVQVIPIAPVRLRILVSSVHPLATRDSVPLAELGGENFILNALHPVSELLTGLLTRHGIGHAIRWRTTSTDVIKNLVGRNLAISPLVSPGISFTSNEGKNLTAIPLTGDLPSQSVVACVAEDVPLGPAHHAVVDILRSLPLSATETHF